MRIAWGQASLLQRGEHYGVAEDDERTTSDQGDGQEFDVMDDNQEDH